MKKSKLLILAISLLVLFSLSLTSCKKSDNNSHYLPDGRPIIRISMINTSNFPAWRSYVEESCPDVYIKWENNRNSFSNLVYEAKNNDLAEIVCIRKYETDSAKELAPYLLDLSSLSLTSTFDSKYLSLFNIDNKQCFIPAPGNFEAIFVNKTLLTSWGYQVPTNYEEFLALGKKVSNEHTETAFATSLGAGYTATSVLEGSTIASYFDTVEGAAWYRSFVDGTASSFGASELSLMYNSLLDLIDNGYVNEADLTDTAQTAAFTSGNALMYTRSTDDGHASINKFELLCLPYYGETAEDGRLFSYPVFSTGLSKALNDDPELYEAAKEVLTAMFSEKGENLIGTNAEGLISYNGYSLPLQSSMDFVKPLIDDDKCFIRLMNSNTFSTLVNAVYEVVKNNASLEQFSSIINDNIFKKVEPKVIGTSSFNATNERDTDMNAPAGSIIAKAVKSSTNTAIAIIDIREVASPIYMGKLTDKDIDAIVFQDTIYTGNINGADLKKILNSLILATTTFTVSSIEPYIDYAAIAGLIVTMKPDGTIIKVSDADGNLIDDNASYAIAVSGRIFSAISNFNNTIAPSFTKISETLPSIIKTVFSTSSFEKPENYFVVKR